MRIRSSFTTRIHEVYETRVESKVAIALLTQISAHDRNKLIRRHSRSLSIYTEWSQKIRVLQ